MPSNPEPETVDTASRLKALEDENARLRLEIWELRDALIGSAAQERTVEFLLRENDRLRYLARRPWRVAGKRAKNMIAEVALRVESKRVAHEDE
ncbi:MAG: hypothetical protein ACKOCL_00930 [Candidatus Nanopelagicaceae bacterium]